MSNQQITIELQAFDPRYGWCCLNQRKCLPEDAGKVRSELSLMRDQWLSAGLFVGEPLRIHTVNTEAAVAVLPAWRHAA